MSKLIRGIMSYILPPSNDLFYSLFETGTQYCKQAAELFDEILTDGITEERIARAKEYKHASSRNIKKTLEVLDTSFVTPIDREDIQNIATLLHKITKKITKSCLNIKIYRLEEVTENLRNQAQTLISATNELGLIFAKEALFSGKYDALNVIKLRDIHKDLENALDSCYSVSDAVVSVVLKLS